jgi:hypothetical protein
VLDEAWVGAKRTDNVAIIGFDEIECFDDLGGRARLSVSEQLRVAVERPDAVPAVFPSALGRIGPASDAITFGLTDNRA